MKKLLIVVISALIISVGINVYQFIVIRNTIRENTVVLNNKDSVDHLVIGEEHTGSISNFIDLINEPVPKSVIAMRNGVTLPHSHFNVKGCTVTIEGVISVSDVFQFNYLVKN